MYYLHFKLQLSSKYLNTLMTEKRKKIITQDGPSALQNVTHNPKESSQRSL